MFNFFKKSETKSINKLEKKSPNSQVTNNINGATSASMVIGSDGRLLKTIYHDSLEEISKNISVNTVINKQSSIINEANLIIKEKNNLENESTKQKDFLNYLDWINNPNSYPFPRSRKEIFKYILENSYKKGIFGIIYYFDINNNFKFIRIPLNIGLWQVHSLEVRYKVSIDNREYDFTYNNKYRNFAIEITNGTEREVMILQVGGNFNNDLQNYVPKFQQVLPYILLQNNLIDFATSFHQNSCFPSQMITLNYEREKDSVGGLDPSEQKAFDDAVKSVEQDLLSTKSSKNSGGIILVKHPNIKIDIKPLDMPTNADDNIKYQDFVSNKIYAWVEGGSVDGFEGKSEYSNNVDRKLQELYDGSFILFNSLIIDPMNQFMQGLIGSFNTNINPTNYFLSFDKSNVSIYQKQYIAQDVMLVQNNMLKIKEAREILIKTSNRYSSIDIKEEDNIFNSQLSGNATETRVNIN